MSSHSCFKGPHAHLPQPMPHCLCMQEAMLVSICVVEGPDKPDFAIVNPNAQSACWPVCCSPAFCHAFNSLQVEFYYACYAHCLVQTGMRLCGLSEALVDAEPVLARLAALHVCKAPMFCIFCAIDFIKACREAYYICLGAYVNDKSCKICSSAYVIIASRTVC